MLAESVLDKICSSRLMLFFKEYCLGSHIPNIFRPFAHVPKEIHFPVLPPYEFLFSPSNTGLNSPVTHPSKVKTFLKVPHH